MKKEILKFLGGLCVGIGILSASKPANASDVSHAVDNAFNNLELEQRNHSNSTASDLTVYISEPITVYADSSQWAYRSPFWVLATPDFHQGYCNTWASINGVWYYINTDGYMVANHMLHDLTSNKKYYIKEDGSLLVNGYYIDYYHSQTKYYAGSDGSLTEVEN